MNTRFAPKTPDRQGTVCLASVAIALLVVGCGSGANGSVAGTVRVAGKPVEAGQVKFLQAATGSVSVATLGEGGSYTLPIPSGGLEPGEYKVVVGPVVTNEKVIGPRGVEYKMVTSGAEGVPRQYHRDATTPLLATLTGGDDTIDFDIEP